MNQLVPVHNGQEYRQSTDAAGLCRGIVTKTASNIQGRKYVSVEGWQAIAIAHGCAAGSRDVQKVDGGVRAIGEVRRMEDGQLIATAEGFVGEDEPTWYGGEQVTRYGKKTLPKRPDYAIRAMAQTRAISRACRSAFAHVVVMIDAGLSTTPAEEVPEGGFLEGQFQEVRTGEPQEPANTPKHQPEQGAAGNDRVARGRNNGPTKTKLDAAENEIVHELNGCGDEDSLIAYLETEEYKAAKALLDEHRPSALYGPAPEDCPEYVPIKARISRMVAEFRSPAREPSAMEAG